jgi:DNA-binding ferritin-like protein
MTTQNDSAIGEILLKLADIANCFSGDCHTMHFNVRGVSFDRVHELLKTYYEQFADDYDRWVELALMFVPIAPSTNDSAMRAQWQSVEAKELHYEEVIEQLDVIFEAYTHALNVTSGACTNIGSVLNALQTRLEYWDKERRFFNVRRRTGVIEV